MTTQRTTEQFLREINRFALISDYSKFCEVLGFVPNTCSEEKYAEFQVLINYLACFDAESLDKLMEDGAGK